MLIKLDRVEIYPVLEEWSGFGVHYLEVELPKDLWVNYTKALKDFLNERDNLNTFLGENENVS